MPQTALQMLTRSKADVFRRFAIKRRLDASSGDYETSWQDLSTEVKRWGSVQWSVDETKYSFFQQAAMSIQVKNDSGLFDHEINPASFWYGYLTRHKTLCRVDAGFIDPDDKTTEIPPVLGTVVASTSTQFIGVMSEPVRLDGENVATLNIKSLSSILEEVPANLLSVATVGAVNTGRLTASNLIGRMRDMTDGSANFILRKFITSTAWTIAATTQTLTALDTTTVVDGENCWSLAVKLAEISNKAVWIDKLGGFHFDAKDPTTTVQFVFSGYPFNNTTYGHTIKKVNNVEEDLNLLFNRIMVRYSSGANDYVLKNQAITVGDSTTAWKYGTRTLSIENSWLNATNAEIIASTLFVDLSVLKDKAELSCKYIPTLNILDRAVIDYDLSPEGGSLWDVMTWDTDNWDGTRGPTFHFSGKEFKVVKINHNLDSMDTAVTLRRV